MTFPDDLGLLFTPGLSGRSDALADQQSRKTAIDRMWRFCC